MTDDGQNWIMDDWLIEELERLERERLEQNRRPYLEMPLPYKPQDRTQEPRPQRGVVIIPI